MGSLIDDSAMDSDNEVRAAHAGHDRAHCLLDSC